MSNADGRITDYEILKPLRDYVEGAGENINSANFSKDTLANITKISADFIVKEAVEDE